MGGLGPWVRSRNWRGRYLFALDFQGTTNFRSVDEAWHRGMGSLSCDLTQPSRLTLSNHSPLAPLGRLGEEIEGTNPAAQAGAAGDRCGNKLFGARDSRPQVLAPRQSGSDRRREDTTGPMQAAGLNPR